MISGMFWTWLGPKCPWNITLQPRHPCVAMGRHPQGYAQISIAQFVEFKYDMAIKEGKGTSRHVVIGTRGQWHYSTWYVSETWNVNGKNSLQLEHTFMLTTFFQWREGICVYENITGYLKNRWTKHRLVCTHFDAFFMLIPNMDMKCNISEIFGNFMKKL